MLKIACGLATVLAIVPSALAQELSIAKQGYFFVGGAIDPKREGSPMVGHMYVEYQVPQRLAHPYPVVMIHGGGGQGTKRPLCPSCGRRLTTRSDHPARCRISSAIEHRRIRRSWDRRCG